VSDPAWWRAAEVALDLAGPVDVAFDEPPSDVVEQAVFGWFEQVVRKTPDAPALDDGRTTLTYARVHADALRLAGGIAAAVPAGRAVAVVLPNAPSSLIAVLACLAARRVCIVLNADHPPERNDTILRDADAHAAITSDGHDARLPPGMPRIAFDAVPSAPLAAPDEPHRPDAPAVVLYTSGSEGQPKGIVLSQATILARVRNNIVASHLHAGDRFFSLGALGTTAGLVAALLALLAGARQVVVAVSAEGAGSVHELIRDRRVTVLWGVPALVGLVLGNTDAHAALASLRVVRTFGDRLLGRDALSWRATLPAACHLAITYGQTEATIAQWHVPHDRALDDAVLPTGYLLPEHDYAIVRADGTPVDDGEPGELIVRGRYVALGEWLHGAVVTGRLRPDPGDPARRILPTGDLARVNADGLLEVLGRVDRQVKINGQRVEPVEVEMALRRVPGVSNAAVAVRRHGEQASLVAFVTPIDRGDAGLSERARVALRSALPGHLRPARILSVDALPLLPGGKVDHAALLAIDAGTASAHRGHPASPRREHAAPRSSAASQRAVHLAWRRVLHVAPASGTTFLEAAGDSLRMLEMVFALESLVKRRLPLDAFDVEDTPLEMALALDAALQAAPVPPRERVFLLPGARGDTPGLAGLRADCLAVAPMRLVDYPGWREMLTTRGTLDGVAAAAAADIAASAPAGPIALVGYSFGAYVAYAVAQRLERDGCAIARLVLIDMPAPGGPVDVPSLLSLETGLSRTVVGRWRDAAREAWWSVNRLVRAARDGMVAERVGMHMGSAASMAFRVPVLRTLARARITHGWSGRLGDVGYWTRHHLAQELRLAAAVAWLREGPQPLQRLRTPVLVVRSEHHRADLGDDLGWRRVADDVSVVRVPGTHVTMLASGHRPSVSAAVADALASALA